MRPDELHKRPLALVTQNEHKLEELRPLFEEYQIKFEPVAIEKFEIRSDTVEEIARIAAEHAFESLEYPTVVDDTGLHINSLNGFPRTYPAFVLETIGTQGILKLMHGLENREAIFTTAVGYADRSGSKTFVGSMHGSISEIEVGSGGFGYDPIFIPSGYDRTYAELDFSEKVRISHRTKAFREFLKWYTKSKLR